MTEEQREKLLDAAASLSVLANQASQRQQENHALHLEQLRDQLLKLAELPDHEIH